MASKKISQLPSGSLGFLPLSGLTPVVYSGTTFQQTLSNLRQTLVDSGSHHFTGSQHINGDLTIIGSLTAQQYILSSSISNIVIENVSGSSNFGNDLIDIHNITGSVRITGSFDVTGSSRLQNTVIGLGLPHVDGPEILHVQNSGSFNIAHFEGNSNIYAQINVQNTNSGNNASSDVVITADNGTENVHYVDLGINSSTYTGGLVGGVNDAYLLNVGKDLYIGTVGGTAHPAVVKLFANNSWENSQITIHTGSQVSFNTGSVTSGYTYEFNGDVKVVDRINTTTIYSDTDLYLGTDGQTVYVVGSNLSVPNGGIYSSFVIQAPNLSGSLKWTDLINVPSLVSGSSQISYTGITNIPSGIISGSGQLPIGLVSGSSQISYTGITNIPSGLVSGSSQVLIGSNVWSGSGQLPLGMVSGSQQIINLGFATTSSILNIDELPSGSLVGDKINSTVGGDTVEIDYGITKGDLTNRFSGIKVYNYDYSGGNLAGQVEIWTDSEANDFSTRRFYIDGFGKSVFETNLEITGSLSATCLTGSLDYSYLINVPTPTYISSGPTAPGSSVVANNTDVDINFSGVGTKFSFTQTGMTFPDNTVQTTAYTGLTAGVVSGSSQITYNSISNIPAGIISGSAQLNDLGYAITGSNIFNGNQTINGLLTIEGVSEVLSVDGNFGVGSHSFDFDSGSVFYLTGLTGNGVWNVNNVPTTNNKVVTITFVVNQGVTAYSGSIYQINSTPVTIKWADNTTPTGSANNLDIIGLTAFRAGNAWNVIGAMTTFGV